jgi:hypothetical protein
MSDQVQNQILAALDAIRREMATREDLGSLHAAILETVRGQIESVLAELASVRAEIMAPIDRLQDRLTADQEGGIVTIGAAERAERIAKAIRDEMRAEIASLAEQIGALLRQNRILSNRLDQIEDRH